VRVRHGGATVTGDPSPWERGHCPRGGGKAGQGNDPEVRILRRGTADRPHQAGAGPPVSCLRPEVPT